MDIKIIKVISKTFFFYFLLIVKTGVIAFKHRNSVR